MESGGTTRGLVALGPRDGVEVWTTCSTCAAPVRLLGEVWHHEGPAAHRVEPDREQRPAGHAYALAALLEERSRRSAPALVKVHGSGERGRRIDA